VDAQAKLDALRERMRLTFPLRSDPDLAVAEAYGVRQQGSDLELPSTFVLGPDRRVLFVHVAKNPVDRLGTARLLEVLAALPD
jgi:peroxiredoxin